MSVDVSTLQLVVDSRQVKEAKADLAALTVQGAETEKALKGIGSGLAQGTTELQAQINRAVGGYNELASASDGVKNRQIYDAQQVAKARDSMYRAMFDEIAAQEAKAAAESNALQKAKLAEELAAKKEALAEQQALDKFNRDRAIADEAKVNELRVQMYRAMFDEIEAREAESLARRAEMEAAAQSAANDARLASVAKNAVSGNGVYVEGERSLSERAGNKSYSQASTYWNETAGSPLSQEEQSALDAARLKTAADVQAYRDRSAAAAAAAAVEVEAAEKVKSKTDAVGESLKLTGMQAREIGADLSELARGNLRQLEGSLIATANRFNLMQSILSPVGISVIALTGAIVGLTVATVRSMESQAELDQLVTRFGHSTGQTAEQIKQASEAYATYNTNAGAVLALEKQLISTGLATSSNFGVMTKAAVAFGEATGSTAEQTTKVFEEIARNPLQTMERLEQLYGNLTPEVLDHIKALQEEGDKVGATKLAYESLLAAMSDTASAENAQKTLVDHIVQRWLNGFDEIKQKFGQLVNGPAMSAQYQRMVEDYQGHLNSTQRNSPLDRLFGQVYSQKELEDEYSNIKAFYNKINQAKEDAANKGAQTEADKTEAQANSYYDSHFAKLDRLQEKQIALNDLTATYKTMWENNSRGDNPRLADVTASYNSKGQIQFSGGQYDRDVAAIDHRYRPFKEPKNPEENAYGNFESYVGSLNVPNITDDGSALTKYEQGVARLADHLNTYMEKSGDATKGAKLFNDGLKELQATYQRNIEIEKEASDAYDAAEAKKVEALQRSINDQVMSVGMGTREYQQAQQITKAYQDEADELERLALLRQKGKNGESGGLSEEQYNHDVDVTKRTTQQKVDIINRGYEAMSAAESNWAFGAKKGLEDFFNEAENKAQTTASLVNSTLDSISQNLVQMAVTGKASWRSLAVSALEAIAQMELKAELAWALRQLMGAFGIGGSDGAGGTMAGVGDGSFSGVAKGGVFEGGNLTPFARGGIVTSPVFRAMANGGTALMGEAGPEAVIPLKRTSDGRMGVAVADGGASTAAGPAPKVSVVVNNYGNDKATIKETGDDLNRQIEVVIGEVDRRISQGGSTAQALESRYNVSRHGGRY